MAPAKKDQQIVIKITKIFAGIDAPAAKIKKLANVVCNLFADPDKSRQTAISIAIVGDDHIRRLNRKFLNRNSTTDCLSFDLSDSNLPQSPKAYELIVNGQMAVRQANKRGHSPQAELALYITHGLLHNLGFDDSTKTKAKKMHEMEDKILQQFGYGLVYNKSTKK